MVAKDFIEEQYEILDVGDDNENYKELELFTYLKSAYIQLQKDRPIFKEKITLLTVADENEYFIKDDVIDVDVVVINNIPYKKRIINRFNEECFSQRCEKIFSFDADKLYIYPALKKDDMEIKISFSKAKRLDSEDADLNIPIFLEESLRLNFLSRACEKLPDRDNRNLSTHYLKRYKQEIYEAKKASKTRHRSVTSDFQII